MGRPLSKGAIDRLGELSERTSPEHVMARFQLSKTTFYDAKAGRPVGDATADRVESAVAGRVVMRPFLTARQVRDVQRAVDEAGPADFDRRSGASKNARVRALKGYSVTSTTIARLLKAAQPLPDARPGRAPVPREPRPMDGGAPVVAEVDGRVSVSVSLTLDARSLAALFLQSVGTGRGVEDLLTEACRKAISDLADAAMGTA